MELTLLPGELPVDPDYGIMELADHALVKRYDGVIRDLDVFRADL